MAKTPKHKSGPAITIKPRLRSHSERPALLPGDPYIPPGVEVQRGPSCRLPHEDLQVPIGGFYSDWLTKRGQP